VAPVTSRLRARYERFRLTSTEGQRTSDAPKASAGLLGWGIVLLVMGQAAYWLGLATGEAALTSSPFVSDGSGLTVIGLIASLVGLILLVSGVVHLAKSVDYLARCEHARSVVAETTPAEDE
jgi:predicted acyltransferase